jgi:alpha-galactosidase
MMAEQEVFIRDQLVVQPVVGLVRFLYQGKVLLNQATAGVVYADGSGQSKTLDLAGHPMSYGLARDHTNLSVANDEVELAWQLSVGEETCLRLEVKNKGPRPVRISELRVLDVDARHGGSLGFKSAPKNWRFYQNGWQSWTPTFARRLANGIWVDPNTEDYRTKHQPHALPQAQEVLSSEWFSVIVPDIERDVARGSPDPALLLGFISARDQLTEIRLRVRRNLQFQSLRAVSYADGVLLEPGEKLSSETLLIRANDDPHSLMDLYAARLGETMQARVGTKIPTGWCTWYYFFGEETTDDVLANLARIEDERLPLGVILIDDGYETNIGDWLDIDEAKYPQGMKAIAGRIAAAGYRPGIWIAPFAASATSNLYTIHPDWILRDDNGEPVLAWRHWGKDVYALDLSLPEVQAWLQGIFRTLSEDWGFEFFKADFVFAGALPGLRSDSRMTRAQALRQGLEIIRAAIGDKFLLGCGAPLGPSVGVVDAMRIGPDVHVEWKPYWQDLSAPAAANAILNSITRSFMHRKLWLNDPDCLLLRPRGDDSNLVLNEMRTLATVVGLTGGLVTNSDNLPSIGRGRLKYLRRVLPPYSHSAVPVDLFQHERPRLWLLPVARSWGSWVLAALLNWNDRSCATRLDLSHLGLPHGDYHVYNYWRQHYVGVVHDAVVIDPHQPHETVLLLLKAVSEQPQLLTSTFHVAQGAVEIKDVRLLEDRLLVEMEKPGKQFGYLLFAFPPEHPVGRVLVNGRPQIPRKVSSAVWRAGFTLSDRATVEVVFD